MTASDPARVLYVDDDPAMRRRVTERVSRLGGFEVTATDAVDDALELLDGPGVDCVVSDYELAGTNGLAFLASVRAHHPNLPFVLFTGRGSEDVASAAISAGVTDYMQKDGHDETYRVLANRIGNAVDGYRTRRALRESEERYRTLVERSHDAIYVYRDGRLRFVNDRLCEFTGYDERTLLDVDVRELVHPDDEDRIREITGLRADGTRAPSTFVARIVTADGSTRHGEFSVQRIDVDDGHAELGSIRDITERVRREEALGRYETIVQASGDPVYALDADGRVTFVNDRLVEITGYDAEELLGEGISVVTDPEDVAAGEALIRDLLGSDDRAPRTFEMDLVTAGGDRIRCENHVALLPFEDGEFRGTTGVLRDVTERRERERALERQNERLEEFARVVSHDLRNPLNVTALAVEVARESPSEANFERAEAAIERMEELIANLLLIAQGESIEVDVRPTRLPAVVETAWVTTETHDATLRVDDGLGVVHCDESRTRQLLENLFRNAVEHGGDDVTVRVRPIEGGFVVEDDGPGLPDVDDETLFTVGYSRSFGGTGYGLSIVRDVARAHGWTVRTVESELDGAGFQIGGVD